MSRQVRVETRSRHQNDLKRVMHSTEKVRKWEKKWVRIEETSLQIFKWMPITKSEEQQREQLQQQISAPISAETLVTAGQDSSFARVINIKADRENNQSVPTENQRLAAHNTACFLKTTSTSLEAMPSAIPNTSASTTINGSSDAHKLSEFVSTTLHSNPNNVNKRPHESSLGYEEPNELVHSPNIKRVKTTEGLIINNNNTGLVISEPVDSHMNSTSMHSAGQTSWPSTASSQPRQLEAKVQQSIASVIVNETSHLLQAEVPLTKQQQHVQPSTINSTTAPCYDGLEFKSTSLNGTGDIEMMDSEDICSQQQQQSHQQPLSTVSEMTDTLMEDFSSIVRNVTEQIVIKVSDCYGGDS